MSRRHHHNFNVLLTSNDVAQLAALADRKGISQAHVIRTAIRTYHTMVIDGVPICANGQRCYVPQMHPPVPAPPHEVHPPVPAPPHA